MIVDLDSHLREGYFLDEVYKLDAPFAAYTPMCVSEGAPHERRFETRFREQRRLGEGSGRAYDHDYMYDPRQNWRGGDIARRQVAGYDMVERLKGNAQEGVDKQLIFPTGISLPAMTEGPLGAALCHAYNSWVR